MIPSKDSKCESIGSREISRLWKSKSLSVEGITYESKGRGFESRRAHQRGDFERGLLFLIRFQVFSQPEGQEEFFDGTFICMV